MIVATLILFAFASAWLLPGGIANAKAAEDIKALSNEQPADTNTPPVGPAVPEITVLLDGDPLAFDVQPLIMNNRTLVPLRIIFEALGAQVEWENTTKTVTATKGDTVIILPIGSKTPTVNGKTVPIDQPGIVKDGRTLVPVRFISESLGAKVNWDGNNRIVSITSPSLLKGKTANTTFSMLDDRFSIKMPEGSVDHSIYYGGIMGSTADSSGETQVVLEEKNQAFFAEAREMFCYSTGDLKKDAELFTGADQGGGSDFVLFDVIKVSNLEYVTFAPKEMSTRGAPLIKGALIKLPDNTLVYLAIYASVEALIYKEDCISMADSVIGTIQEGKRLLDTSPRTVQLYDTNIRLEKDYVFIIQFGIDFDVCYFYKVVPLDMAESQPTFGIYTGGHPSQFGSMLPYHEQKPGKILGRDITWDIYSTDKGIIAADTFIETFVEYDGWYKHIFVVPRSASEWQIIEKMIYSLK